MQTIGLTGGIGSGKSLIARVLKHMGYPVYIADTEAKRLMHSHPDIRREIIRRFGETVYTNTGILDKALLAQLIFTDAQALSAINAIVHPRVIEDFRQWSECQNSPLVFFESAILFEASLDHYFNHILCVTTSLETRIQRVMSRDHTTRDKVIDRLRNQMDEREKCRRADVVICNDEGQMVLSQVLAAVKELTIDK